MVTWDVFLKPVKIDIPRQWWTARQWVGIIEGDSQDQAARQAAPVYGKAGYDLVVQPTPRAKRPDFDPTQALARYRELEALLNLELINNPVWQRMRAQGDTSFLRESRHFQAQEKLSDEIEANGYTLIDSEDEQENTVYEIEPLEE